MREQMQKEMLEKYDTDKDGKLSEEERAAMPKPPRRPGGPGGPAAMRKRGPGGPAAQVAQALLKHLLPNNPRPLEKDIHSRGPVIRAAVFP